MLSSGGVLSKFITKTSGLYSYDVFARSFCFSCWTLNGAVKLLEVGRFAELKENDKYCPGQFFLHKVFGYRGVALFRWEARVFNRDPQLHLTSLTTDHDDGTEGTTSKTTSSNSRVKEVVTENSEGEINIMYESVAASPDKTTWSQSKPKNAVDANSTQIEPYFESYYQVLIDERDWPYLRTQAESVTFLATDKAHPLYAVPGLDYVAHSDILPYTSVERPPIQHELFEKFFLPDIDSDPPFRELPTLATWIDKNYSWLQLSQVHVQTTEKIKVTAIPFYIGSRSTGPETIEHWWRYCIRMENLGDETVTLRERYWKIFSLSGVLDTVKGHGVVGTHPVLSKLAPAFQYSSHVSLNCASGHMWGVFKFERDNGFLFECTIPAFPLESKRDDSDPVTRER